MTTPATLTEKQTAFLTAYRQCGNVSAAAKAAGVARTTHYEWLRGEAYRGEFDDAKAEAVDVLEGEARRRAVDGWEEPVFYQGRLTGTVRKYSDTLLIFLLKGAAPEKYRERHEVAASAEGAGGIVFNIVEARRPDETEAEYRARTGPVPKGGKTVTGDWLLNV